MQSVTDINKLYFRDTSFVSLMPKRIFNVLLVANPYDAFMLEDDGRIDEKIFNEYMDLSLRYPPRFTQVSTEEETWEKLNSTTFDLVICMPGSDNNTAFDIARDVKSSYPNIPIVVLTPFSHGITRRMENEDLSMFEYVFCWLGNTDLILSIIKLVEDKMNLDHDVREVGVQMILFVEDSIRFYSSILPHLYKFVLQQSMNFATEALNAHQQTLRMRGRPKIVLARNFEEASLFYDRYADNVLGVITDASFPKGGKPDQSAGVQLMKHIREHDAFVPIIFQSSETENKEYADRYEAIFVDKNSKKLNIDLRQTVMDNFGFGDFVFINPKTGGHVWRVHNLRDLQNAIFKVPKESLFYHLSHNHVSRWLYSRAMFPLAEFLKRLTCNSQDDVDAHRQIIFDAIVRYRKLKNQGVVAVFKRDRFDRFSNFARIGEGSLGGKGRGLAFIDSRLKLYPELQQFENASVVIPKTVVLCTDIFDEFMDNNDLYHIALSDADDATILKHFLAAELPDRLEGDFLAFFDAVKTPIAIRSSSLLEDSHYQPFAGIYSTYMIPCLDDKQRMLGMLEDAIKSVYASVYYRDSKDYMQATSNVIDQEKMAVVLQEVVGRQYGDKFYPSISGVARSLNYYPVGEEKAEEGVANLALGLGKYIVDGGLTLRMCPYHPDNVMQTSELEMALRETQTRFYALDLKNNCDDFVLDDGFNLLHLPVSVAEEDGALQYIASTFDPYDNVIYDSLIKGGRKIITFANILQHNVFPLSRILQIMLDRGQKAMQRPVEIEFAVNFDAATKSGVFYMLQIRPMVDLKADLAENLDDIPDGKLLLKSNNSLGHGVIEDLCDVVYVKTENYSAANNPIIARQIEKINRKFLSDGRFYILIGPGRWGSSDYWLGVPVKWPHISAAKVIVEAGLTNYRVDPSQGTHFFQNLTSFGVGYFTVNAYINEGLYNKAVLDAMQTVEETEYVRHVRFSSPLTVKMDGRKQKGVVVLPDNFNLE